MAKYRKLGRTSSQRKALLRSQVTALIENGKIVTTEARAKEVRKQAEKLITLAVKEKDNFLNSLAISILLCNLSRYCNCFVVVLFLNCKYRKLGRTSSQRKAL